MINYLKFKYFKVCFALLVSASCLSAKTIRYEEQLPEVKGGSWKEKCFITMDLNKRLLNMAGCSVLDTADRFVFYDKQGNYIGDYFPAYTYIEGGNQYINMKLRFSNNGLFNTVGIEDVYMAQLNEPKWNLNKNDIRCKNKNAVVYPMGDGSYGCFVEYSCPKGQYAVDKFKCEDLPRNTKRLEQIGYICLDGFMNMDGECVKKKNCEPNEIYQELDNECYELPEHAQWADGASSSNEFYCDDGYIADYVYRECKEKVKACDENSVVSKDELSCERIPVLAHKINEYRWVCDEGYKRVENSCWPLATCEGPDEFYASDTECGMIPENAHKEGRKWECNKGFVRNSEYGHNGHCDEIPQNAHLVDRTTWECDEGFLERRGQCIIDECDDNQIIDTLENICVDIPKHAYKWDKYSAYCNEGFHEDDDGCVRDPIVLNMSVLLRGQFEGGLGEFLYEPQKDYENNSAILGFLGVGLAMEIVVNDNVTVGIGDMLKMDWHSYEIKKSHTEQKYNISFLENGISAFLAVGSQSTKIFAKPVFVMNIAESVSTNDVEAVHERKKYGYALESGVRFNEKHDLFLGYENSKYNALSISKSNKGSIYIGYRYNKTFTSFEL